MSTYHTITASDGEEIFNIKNFDALHYWAQEKGKFIEQAEDYKRISLTYKKLEELKEDIKENLTGHIFLMVNALEKFFEEENLEKATLDLIKMEDEFTFEHPSNFKVYFTNLNTPVLHKMLNLYEALILALNKYKLKQNTTFIYEISV